MKLWHGWAISSCRKQVMQSLNHVLSAFQRNNHLPLPLDVLQTTFSNAFERKQVSRKCIPKDLIDDKSSLVQLMAQQRTGDKSLLATMMTHCIDIYIYIYIRLCGLFPSLGPLVYGYLGTVILYYIEYWQHIHTYMHTPFIKSLHTSLWIINGFTSGCLVLRWTTCLLNCMVVHFRIYGLNGS